MKLPAHKKMLSAAAAASVMLLTAACGSGSDDASDSPSSSSTSSTSSDDASDASSSTYKDGDYEEEESYANPGGESKVKVELKLASNKISEVTVTPMAENATSKQFQQKFASGISDEVVGKSLDELNVSKVAGSSLTSIGFNAAIGDIKADAKA
jgi:uncharacterized protein with FMN-binding domain